ncbi:DnaD domain-containing protein [Metasolibacillus meyeri]|uniref:DnaD domain-containing protein n=1 Tax=Metasolibacillus meyeri TaxID=1071052 RepID=A0AAW9NQW8_9BACL|nr:DnaD domain-containing protein [Metasolibacillus meyeri]MEC1178288.1 DnaD domain-containing protein [Metasolibacillus meyeri]
MTSNEQFRIWLEQKNITMPQLFFQHYKELQIRDDDAMLLLHLLAFHEEGNDFPTPADLMARTFFAANEISMKLQRFLQKGFIEITHDVDIDGKIYEKYSLYPLWSRIVRLLEANSIATSNEQQKKEEGAIYSIFEQEFGRLLSPMELENINSWLDIDKHSPELIRAALKEAVLAGKLSLRYIDRILFEWKKKNFTTVKQVEQHAEQFRKRTITQPQTPADKRPKRPIYNWLEEKE